MSKETGNTKMSFISTGELLNELENPALRLIDIRSPDAYNGWKFRNEKRGGHIEGAKNLPAKWAEYIDWLEIVRSKDILPENSLAIYGYDKGETGKIARRFLNLGYPEVKIYQDFVDQWSGSEAFLNAWLMGWQDISLYDGGWYQWSKDEENQYETGIPE